MWYNVKINEYYRRKTTERIEKLRQEALSTVSDKEEFLYRFYKRYGEKKSGTDYTGYADAFYYALSKLTPSISEGELIVGKIKDGLTDCEREEWTNT